MPNVFELGAHLCRTFPYWETAVDFLARFPLLDPSFPPLEQGMSVEMSDPASSCSRPSAWWPAGLCHDMAPKMGLCVTQKGLYFVSYFEGMCENAIGSHLSPSLLH